MSSIILDFAGHQDIGRRESQQDDFLLLPLLNEPHLVCLLADGMGGHVAGEVAAKEAIKAFADELEQISLPAHNAFEHLLDRANRALARKVSVNPDFDGMGCTFVALEVIENNYRWISIGDSPLYLVRNGQLKRENADHSMAGRLDAAARAGEITWEEARTSPNRNALLCALTGEQITRLDCPKQSKHLNLDDWLILASDGLNTLGDEEIVSEVERAAPSGAKAVVDALLSAVKSKNRPTQDNTTIIAVRLLTTDNHPLGAEDDANEVVTRPILGR